MSETQTTICDWADEVFGEARSLVRACTRLNEEMAELLTKAAMKAPLSEIAGELADCYILLMRCADVAKLNLIDEVDAKMRINRARRWVRDGSGHGYHVKTVVHPCQLPPPGWACTRERGHEGPCAAWPLPHGE